MYQSLLKKFFRAAVFCSAWSSGFLLQAQLKPEAIFSSREMVWYGLDFSQARFVGRFDQGFGMEPASEFDLVHTYIPAWNALVLAEPQNFNLRSTFWKEKVSYDLGPVTRINKAIVPDGIITYKTHELSKAALAQMIKNYPAGEDTVGLGLVFIVESFDKIALMGSFWVVFFDIKTRNILLSSYCYAPPAGFGLRNYWAGSLKQVLREIHDQRFKLWKRGLHSKESLKEHEHSAFN